MNNETQPSHHEPRTVNMPVGEELVQKLVPIPLNENTVSMYLFANYFAGYLSGQNVSAPSLHLLWEEARSCFLGDSDPESFDILIDPHFGTIIGMLVPDEIIVTEAIAYKDEFDAEFAGYLPDGKSSVEA